MKIKYPALISAMWATQVFATDVFINELHYDNAGTDVGEFVEVVAPAGTDLTGYKVLFYNGSNGTQYISQELVGLVADMGNGFGTYAIDVSGIQNGAPDGVALVDASSTVIQFLSYEGSFTATDGDAAGMTSVDIGVSETSATPEGASLQLTGTGAQYNDFTWQAFNNATRDALNEGQTFTGNEVVFFNEIHYDNAGTDVGEFIEIAGTAGLDLTGMTIELYNGSNGAVYNTIALSGTLPDNGNGFGTIAVLPSSIQNGAPDGMALVSATGEVIQFLSYEGVMTATDGAAVGTDSTDIGVAETSSTEIGQSLQLSGSGTSYSDFTWIAGAESPNNTNPSQTFNGNGGGTDPEEPEDPEEPDPETGDVAKLFINELHYDNVSSDVNEFVEIAGPAGTDLTGVSIELYNGNGGTVYSTVALSGTIPNQANGFGTLVTYISGIQNGSPDGVALSYNGELIDFISYEGDLTATSGSASGVTASDIGVAETGTTLDSESLQLSGTGSEVCHFSWSGPAAASPGEINAGQTFDTTVGATCGGGDGGDGGTGGELTLVKISAVQGSGSASPLVNTQVAIEAIVVADHQSGSGSDGDLRGFFVQEEDADADSDASTSEGLFVFDGSSPSVNVSVGDKVYLVGTVAEYFGDTQLDVQSGSVQVVSSGNALPTPAVITLPVATTTNSSGEAIADLEAYEGMQVMFAQTLAVTELFNLDRFGEILLSSEGRQVQYTEINAPSASGYAAYVAAAAANRLMLDDGFSIQNPSPIRFPAPGLSTANAVRMSDEVTNLTGVISYRKASGGSGDEMYRLMPTVEPVFTRPEARKDRPDVGGSIQVASFNLLNFFNTFGSSCYLGGGTGDCRGADNAEEYARQLQKTVTAITALDADVLGVIEIENDIVEGSNSAMASLVTALNQTESACSNYQYVDPLQRVGTDAIAVGFLYCADTVEVTPGSTLAILDDSQLAALGLSSYAPVFDGSSTSRPSLTVSFTEKATSEVFTVSVNHFKSKGGSGTGGNADAGDGAGNWNERRTQAAEVLHKWLATYPTGVNDDDILIIGDLNAYSMEDPIVELTSNGYTSVTAGEAHYSYVFDGFAGNLDHGLASASLMDQITGATSWNINSDEADALDYNTDFGRPTDIFDGTTPYRTSDHDPLLIGLSLSSALKGDLDGDGDIDLNDFILIMRAILTKRPYDAVNDINGDGLVNTLDGILLRRSCTRSRCAVR
ncbi:ExeM/NucH family extracellular endonuclease [Alteromonas sp. AMM-1]|uniref:ExeM/NucH family extracellular endonuclease n=1 Tax=Alteromonas sp. AMM-1 TaxID=3394233 RepID=UPI0039A52421